MKQAADRTAVFENMPVRQAVCRQIVPAIASQMIALIYNLADTYFVGMLNKPDQTAAVTVVYSSFVMLTAISNLFGVGGASALSRALGKKQTEDARRIASVSFWGGLLSAVFFSALFLLFAHPVLVLCGATPEIYDIAFGYALWVVVIGGPGTILNTLLANLVRAEGSAAAAAAGVSMGGILNIVLDPVFVLPQFLNLGAAGAGMATAISNMAATLYFLIYIAGKRGQTVVNIHPARLRFAGKYIKNILTIGFPSAVQYALTVVAIAAQSRFVSQYATEAMAALGIVKKLDQLPLYFSIGVSNGLLPLLAYNHSAGNQDRRRKAFRLGCLVSFGFSMLCLAAYEVFAPQLASLFISDPETIYYSTGFLRRMVTAMPMMSVCYPMIIQFQAMGKFKESLICSILRKGVLDIPLLFLMNGLLGLYGCMWVQPIVDTVSLIAAAGFYRRLKKAEGI
ncbi:MAG: MATE family efflux transporter [Clostridium sp.]|nr:MATE family efflux transporter [Clostridium sp.]